jgi:probable HAF family extracellular repeat protein
VCLGIVVAVFLCLASELYAQPSYTLSDLGFSGIPFAINNNGQIAGRIDTAPNSHAFIYSAGTTTDLGPLFPYAAFSEATGVNASGQVAGNWNPLSSPGAFLYTNGVITYLPPFPGGSQSFAYAINDSGQIVGSARNSNSSQHATLWQNGTPTDLGTLPDGVGSSAQGINNNGQITGNSFNTLGNSRVFLYSNGSMTDVGTLPCGGGSQAYAINNLGEITGWSSSCLGFPHAFLYSNGRMNDLFAPHGATSSYGYGINDSGQVTGSSYGTVGGYRAFLYSGGVMYDLNDLIASGSGWTLVSGQAINRYGQITGIGSLNGAFHIFLLTPTVDTFPPITTAVQSPPPNASGWNKANVTVSLTSTDNSGGSGVKQIQITLSGAQTGSQLINGTGASVTVTAEGLTTVTWYAVDVAGNVEAPKSLPIRIDRTAPAVTGLPMPGCVIWPPDKRLVQFTVSGSDALSGLSSLAVSATSSEPISPGDIVINGGSVQLRANRNSDLGRVYTVNATASDIAGNITTASGTCTVPHDQAQ